MASALEAKLSLEEVFGEMRAVVDVLAARGAKGATREELDSSCEDFHLHTMAYVRFLEHGGFVEVSTETGQLILRTRPDVRHPGPLSESLRSAFWDHLRANDQVERGAEDNAPAPPTPAVAQSAGLDESIPTIVPPPLNTATVPEIEVHGTSIDSDEEALDSADLEELHDALHLVMESASPDDGVSDPPTRKDFAALDASSIEWSEAGEVDVEDFMRAQGQSEVIPPADSTDEPGSAAEESPIEVPSAVEMAYQDMPTAPVPEVAVVEDAPSFEPTLPSSEPDIVADAPAPSEPDIVADAPSPSEPDVVADAPAPSEPDVVADAPSPSEPKDSADAANPVSTEIASESSPEKPKGVQSPMNIPAPTASAPGASRYEKLDALGSGATSTVYRARQIQINRVVALRELREVFEIFANVNRDDIVARFQNIAETHASLDQPNILPIIDIDIHAEFPFLVTMYAPNGNLRRITGVEGRPNLRTSLKYFLQILHAMKYAHDHGVLHGSLKPENVLLDPSGNARITDFGMSRVAELDASRANQVFVGVGAVAYMSPEQFRTPNIQTVKSDIYALGIMFYELLVGKVPGRRSPMPSSFFPDIPRSIDDIFDRMCYDDEEGRYGDIGEILDDIYGTKEIMSLMDRKTGLLFTSDPLSDPQEESPEESDESVEFALEESPAGTEAVDDDPAGEEASEQDEESEAGESEGDVLAKLSKYGEMFDG